MTNNTILIIAAIAIGVVLLIYLVSLFLKKKKKSEFSEDYENEQIYVGNLAYRVAEQDLNNYFSQFGKIRDTKIVKNYRTGRSKGFAFVRFANTREANRALAAHGDEFMGRTLVVRIAKPR